MSKKIYFGTNLKMYKTIKETTTYLQELEKQIQDIDCNDIELFVIPSYTSLPAAVSCIQQSRIKIGSQNMCWEEQGQFTGEISPLMLTELGVDLVMIGHSERRHVFGESNEEENLKVKSVLSHGFTSLLCVGETKEEKDFDISDEALRTQLKIGFHDISKEYIDKIWVAYEPVWSIGVNGTPASADYAQQKHAVIRETLIELWGHEANKIPILYGGSVNPQNANELIAQPSIDGLFIGRSAWQASNFAQIIHHSMQMLKNI